MRKSEMLAHWDGLVADQAIKPKVVPYRHTGSTFDQDSIRITGSQSFIDSVLSRVKDLLVFENTFTRLQVSYKQSTDRETGEALDAYNCYIQVHERGREAKIANILLGR